MRKTVALLILLGLAFGEPLKVAAASSLRFALEEIKREFERRTGEKVSVSYGASGHFYLQIKNGAPYEVFLSANALYPIKLVEEGKAVKESYREFARGRLALFTKREDLSLTGLSVLTSPKVKRIAVANPKYAPYGIAAVQVLKNSGLYPRIRHKLLFGANVSQAFQFVVSGGADVGLVALSLVIPYGEGKFLEVPGELYTPVRHGAVITIFGKDRRLAWEFLDFLSSDYSKEVLERYGFGTDVGSSDAQP